MKEPKFFTKEDLLTVKEWDNEEYDGDSNEHQRVRQFLTDFPENKTKYWTEEVANRLRMVCKTRKDPRKRGYNTSLFKGYTWGRIFRMEQPTKEVFFTVGINGDKKKDDGPFLHIKIDRKFQVSSKLTKQQLEKAKQLLVKENGEYRHEDKVSIYELDELDWESLIQRTINFVRKYEFEYDKIIHEVADNQKKFFTRICWNSNGWTSPCGPEGKSTSEDSFEGITGFGMEEWLFADQLHQEGYQYGFIQGVNQNQPNKEVIDVDLYAVEDKIREKEAYWVCSIKDVKIIDEEEIQRIQKATGFKEKVNRYLKRIPKPEKINQDISSYVGDNFLNVKFKLSNVDYPETPGFKEVDLDLSRYKRYKLYRGSLFDQLPPEVNQRSTGLDLLGKSSGSRSQNSTSFGRRSPGNYEIKHVHDQISKGVVAYLKGLKKSGKEVLYEVPLGSYRRVDVVYEKSSEINYYEIKTHQKLIFCIREGIGQLLEYGYYNRPTHDKELNLILVSPHGPTDDLRVYMEKLRAMSEFNIYYQQYDENSKKLMNKI